MVPLLNDAINYINKTPVIATPTINMNNQSCSNDSFKNIYQNSFFPMQADNQRRPLAMNYRGDYKLIDLLHIQCTL